LFSVSLDKVLKLTTWANTPFYLICL